MGYIGSTPTAVPLTGSDLADSIITSAKIADGAIVNEKESEPISEAESVYIVLSGADLALVDNHPVERFVTIKGTYDSALGNDLPLIDEVSFQIKNLVGEPQA